MNSDNDDNPWRVLQICDIGSVVGYSLLLIVELVVCAKYLIPLRVKSPYILLFYISLFVLLVSSLIEILTRLT